MTATNADLQNHLYRIADLLDLSGANSFRIRAYRGAAHTLGTLTENAAVLILTDKIREFPGIGNTISGCLREYVTTGSCSQLDSLHRKLPSGLLDLLQITGLGPKRIRRLHDELGIASLTALEEACQQRKVEKLSGFGAKTQKNILDEIAVLGETVKRRTFEEVSPIAEQLLAFLRGIPGASAVTLAGSMRRHKPIIKDIDVIISTTQPQQVGKEVVAYPEMTKILAHGDTKISMRINPGIQTDIRLIHPDSFVCALAYFTGSKDFNVALRLRALERGYSLNEYVLRPLDGSPPPSFTSEAELHAKLGLPYIPPEQRETAAKIQ